MDATIHLPGEYAEPFRRRAESIGKSADELLADILTGARGPRLLFEPGEILTAPEAAAVIEASGTSLADLTDRHASGDCGTLEDDGSRDNLRHALERTECPIFSGYDLKAGRVLFSSYLSARVTRVETSDEYTRRELPPDALGEE